MLPPQSQVVSNLVCLQAAQAGEAEVSHRGRYVLRVDATEALHPYDLSVAVAPELTSLSMENLLQIPVMDDTTATLGCAPLTQRGQAHGAQLPAVLHALVLAEQMVLQCLSRDACKSIIHADNHQPRYMQHDA